MAYPITVKIWANAFIPRDIDSVSRAAADGRTLIPPPFGLPARRHFPWLLTDQRDFSDDVADCARSQLSVTLTIKLTLKDGKPFAKRADIATDTAVSRSLLCDFDPETAGPPTVLSSGEAAATAAVRKVTVEDAESHRVVSVDILSERGRTLIGPRFRIDGAYHIHCGASGVLKVSFRGFRREFPALESYYSVDDGPAQPIFRMPAAETQDYWRLLVSRPKFFVDDTDMTVDDAVLDAVGKRAFADGAALDEAFRVLGGVPQGGGFLEWLNQSYARGQLEPARIWRSRSTRRPLVDPKTARPQWDLILNRYNYMAGRRSDAPIKVVEAIALFCICYQEVGAPLLPLSEGGPEVGFKTVYAYNRNDKHHTNQTAAALMRDQTFVDAHKGEIDAKTLANWIADKRWSDFHQSKYSPSWPSKPSDKYGGFVAQFDFFKFRGRGLIQLTWRGHYVDLIGNALGRSWADAGCKAIIDRWKQSPSAEDIATLSMNEEWETLFAVQQTDDRAFILSEGIRVHAHEGRYLTLADDAATLFSMALERPPQRSLARMAEAVNGGAQMMYATTLMLRVASILRSIAAAGGLA